MARGYMRAACSTDTFFEDMINDAEQDTTPSNNMDGLSGSEGNIALTQRNGQDGATATSEMTDSVLGRRARPDEFNEVVVVTKRDFNLAARSQARLETYAQTPGPGRTYHAIAAFGLGLAIFDLLAMQVHNMEWKASPEFELTMLIYARHFIWSGFLTAYRGTAADVAFAAMQQAHVASLPTSLDTARIALIITIIAKYMNRFRNELKAKIIESLVEGSPHRNIANLAAYIVGDSSVQIIIPFLTRLALLRKYVRQYAGSETAFWPQFDSNLAAMYAKDSAVVRRVLERALADDMDTYGNIADVDVTTVLLDSRSPIQRAIDTFAHTVKRKNMRGAVVAAPATRTTTSASRARRSSVSSSVSGGGEAVAEGNDA